MTLAEQVPAPADATGTVSVAIFVDRAEAARRLSLSVRELDRERAAGRILAKRKGAKVLIPISELERFAASLPWDEPKR
jgi:hypothetical protein